MTMTGDIKEKKRPSTEILGYRRDMTIRGDIKEKTINRDIRIH